MIHHHVMVKLTDSAGAQALGDRMRALADEIPGVLSVDVQLDAGFDPHNYDLLYIAQFASREDLDRYLAHPAHQAFVTDVLTPVMKRIAALQSVS